MAVEVDWSRPRTGCKTCDHPSFHVCTVGKPDLFPNLLKSEAGKKRGPRQMVISEEERETMSKAQRARWEPYHTEMQPIYDLIVERYLKGDISIKGIVKELQIGRAIVLKALERAVDEGHVVKRKPGHNIRYEN